MPLAAMAKVVGSPCQALLVLQALTALATLATMSWTPSLELGNCLLGWQLREVLKVCGWMMRAKRLMMDESRMFLLTTPTTIWWVCWKR